MKNEKNKIFRPNKFLYSLIWPLILLTLGACGSSGEGSVDCDMIANPNGPAYFKVVNKLASGLAWDFQDSYPFGADMKPGECVKMGVSASQYTIRLQQCNIGDASCTSNIGSSQLVVFSVGQGDTYTLTVDSSFFN